MGVVITLVDALDEVGLMPSQEQKNRIKNPIKPLTKEEFIAFAKQAVKTNLDWELYDQEYEEYLN